MENLFLSTFKTAIANGMRVHKSLSNVGKVRMHALQDIFNKFAISTVLTRDGRILSGLLLVVINVRLENFEMELAHDILGRDDPRTVAKSLRQHKFRVVRIDVPAEGLGRAQELRYFKVIVLQEHANSQFDFQIGVDDTNGGPTKGLHVDVRYRVRIDLDFFKSGRLAMHVRNDRDGLQL